MEHSLSLSMIRGQGYDGASNMKGHVNGLKKLIMDECPQLIMYTTLHISFS